MKARPPTPPPVSGTMAFSIPHRRGRRSRSESQPHSMRRYRIRSSASSVCETCFRAISCVSWFDAGPMAYEFLTSRREGPVEHLTLNRPAVRNAFNEHVIDELARWAKAAAADETLRCAVLAGAGKVFSAGADVTWMSKMVSYSHEENVRDARALARMFSALDSLPMPLIGRVQGAALGGGSGLASVCDIVVADEE